MRVPTITDTKLGRPLTCPAWRGRVLLVDCGLLVTLAVPT